MTLAREALNRILEAGSLAPSGDNLQPWRVETAGDLVRVSIDPERDRSLYNYRFRPSLIALGACIENMSIAATAVGAAARVELQVDANPDLRSARIGFEPSNGGPDPLVEWIPRRGTNRRPYRRTPVQQDALAALRAVAAAAHGAELRFIQDRAAMRRLAAAASLNDRLLFEVRRLHDGVFQTIRWTPEEAERTRDGLFIRTLELGPAQLSFRMARSWTFVRAMRPFGMSRMAPLHSRQTFVRSGAFGFLQMTSLSPEAFVVGGRILERLWLATASLGLCFQPMAGMLYLLWYLRSPEAAVFTGSQRSLLERAEAVFTPLLGLDDGRAAILLFRIGYGPPPSATSLRRPLS